MNNIKKIIIYIIKKKIEYIIINILFKNIIKKRKNSYSYLFMKRIFFIIEFSKCFTS